MISTDLMVLGIPFPSRARYSHRDSLSPPHLFCYRNLPLHYPYSERFDHCHDLCHYHFHNALAVMDILDSALYVGLGYHLVPHILLTADSDHNSVRKHSYSHCNRSRSHHARTGYAIPQADSPAWLVGMTADHKPAMRVVQRDYYRDAGELGRVLGHKPYLEHTRGFQDAARILERRFET